MIKKRLSEVLVLRPLLIVFVIVAHCFACYSGSWNIPSGLSMIKAYKIVNPLFSAAVLQSFVFVSGYLFAFNSKKNNEISFFVFLKNKFKRIMIPSIIFSTLYFVLFQFNGADLNSLKGITEKLIYILNGAGHLWFLPMLFWNYILFKLFFNKIKTHPLVAIIIAILIYLLLTVLKIDIFRVSTALMYFPFFIIGYFSFGKLDLYKKYITIIISLFILFFVFKQYIIYSVDDKLIRFVTTNGWFYIGGFLGSVGFILISKFLTEKYNPKESINKFNNQCYGAYIFHQFIITGVLYHTAIVQYINPFLLPFALIGIAILCSFSLSALLLKTKTGRFLIG